MNKNNVKRILIRHVHLLQEKNHPKIVPPVDADTNADGEDDNAKENDTTRNDKDKKEEEEEKETMKKVDEKVDEENNNCPEEKGEEETETEEDKKPAAKEQIVSIIEEGKTKKKRTPKTVSCRKVFVFIQQTIASFAHTNPERGIKLYLEAALTAETRYERVYQKKATNRIS
mmetsp:Transcript_35513/g.36031  ORF Transcript_35513/g.36031 Transcript_35513/m.36031 type:complete len:172 (-) Transcript_35513:51-566(-)